VGTGTTIQVSNDFAASLHPTAFDDCWLTPEEMATSPAAMEFGEAFRATTAAMLGVSVDDVVLDGISTDGDSVPGCHAAAVGAGTTIQVSNDFAATLHPTAFDDCWLTPEEMATSPAAMEFGEAFRATTAAALGVSVDEIVLDGISTDGDSVPGCHAAAVLSTTTIQVSNDFATSLHPTAFDDCWLTPEEIATQPAAMAFAEAFRASTAAAMGVSPDTLVIDGISTDGDTIPGCAEGSTAPGGR